MEYSDALKTHRDIAIHRHNGNQYKPKSGIEKKSSGAVAVSDSSSGKHWLRGLNLRAEEVLWKMMRTPITEEEIVAMATTVHPLVAKWGKTLEDIRLELLDIPGLDGVDQGKPKEEQQEQDGKMERSGLLALKEEEIRLITLMEGTDRPNRRFSIRNSRW